MEVELTSAARYPQCAQVDDMESIPTEEGV
jgi:hypothetical protein